LTEPTIENKIPADFNENFQPIPHLTINNVAKKSDDIMTYADSNKMTRLSQIWQKIH
jgi:hypothetical protein